MVTIKNVQRVKIPQGEINGRTGKVRYYDLEEKDPTRRMKWGWPVDVREKIAMKVARLLTTDEANGAGAKMTVHAVPEKPAVEEDTSDDDPKAAAERAAVKGAAAPVDPPDLND